MWQALILPYHTESYYYDYYYILVWIGVARGGTEMLFSKEDVGGKETSEVVETFAGDTSTTLEYFSPRDTCY